MAKFVAGPIAIGHDEGLFTRFDELEFLQSSGSVRDWRTTGRFCAFVLFCEIKSRKKFSLTETAASWWTRRFVDWRSL